MCADPVHHDYPRPPIVEALCQITFDRIDGWGVAAPGRLWTAIEADYPQEPQLQQQMQAQLDLQQGSQSAISVNAGGQRVIFKNKAGTRLVVAGADTLSVNSLAPYEGWKRLRRRFTKAVDAYLGCFGSVAVRQVTVKYINRIVVPDGANPPTFFRVPIWTTGGGVVMPKSVLARIESTSPEGFDLLAVFATLQPPEGGWLLDLEVRTHDVPEAPTTEQLLSIADMVHRAENAEFERSITAEARKLFR